MLFCSILLLLFALYVLPYVRPGLGPRSHTAARTAQTAATAPRCFLCTVLDLRFGLGFGEKCVLCTVGETCRTVGERACGEYGAVAAAAASGDPKGVITGIRSAELPLHSNNEGQQG